MKSSSFYISATIFLSFFTKCHFQFYVEILPDEILILVFHYTADASQIFETFLSFIQILLDRQLHLLTNHLYFKLLNESDGIQ